MGFWHTGYLEFHDHSGLGEFRYRQSPPEYRCAQCSETFSTTDELRKHRFEDHPLLKPVLILSGRELGSHPFRAVTPINECDIVAEKCDRAIVNGMEVATANLPKVISSLEHGVSRMTLISGDVSAEFILDICIASEDDLLGVENEFVRTANGKRLDAKAIDDFIAATRRFGTAITYCDGICSYLYGVLAKERSDDSSLPENAYVKKYNKAVEELIGYDRPLARTISSLIEFHFNHFQDAMRLAGHSRIGQAASKYDEWLRGVIRALHDDRSARDTGGTLEGLVSDWGTEQIARWVTMDFQVITRYLTDMEAFVAADNSDYDRQKVKVLLAEIYAFNGDAGASRHHAKELRNMPAFEAWAERLLLALAGDTHDFK